LLAIHVLFSNIEEWLSHFNTSWLPAELVYELVSRMRELVSRMGELASRMEKIYV
jgi:hypothetical protein